MRSSRKVILLCLFALSMRRAPKYVLLRSLIQSIDSRIAGWAHPFVLYPFRWTRATSHNFFLFHFSWITLFVYYTYKKHSFIHVIIFHLSLVPFGLSVWFLSLKFEIENFMFPLRILLTFGSLFGYEFLANDVKNFLEKKNKQILSMNEKECPEKAAQFFPLKFLFLSYNVRFI